MTMSDEHDHHDHAHEAPEALDAGSQALAEALRSSFAIVKIVMVLMVWIFFRFGIFPGRPQEKAVILRFGKPVGEGRKPCSARDCTGRFRIRLTRW
jgi:modulator of FtsH protease HflK